MEDVISHEQSLTFTRQIVTAADLAEWSDATLDSAGRLTDAHAFTGSSNADTQPLKLKQLIFTDSQHSSQRCKCFAFSADGKLLAASFESSDILVWRLSDGLLVQRLHRQGHTDRVMALSFSPVDYTLVSGSNDRTAIVWDTRCGRVLLRLGRHNGTVDSIAYAPNGTAIATGSGGGDRSVKIWDALIGAYLHSFSVDEDVYSLAFSPDGSFLCVELDTSCNIYGIHTYTRAATLQHVVGKRLFSSMSHQVDRIVTAPDSDDPGQVKIWSTVTGEELLTIDHSMRLSYPVAFSPNGAEVVAGCEADTAAVTYDSRTGQLRHVFKLTKPAHLAAYSPDGHYIAFGARFGSHVELYDAKSEAFLANFDGQEEAGLISEIRFSSDSHALLARFEWGPLLLYNVQDVLRMR
ncbi:uncharacterized protein PHACADRAFT_253781 [Phanerochaete carnosa HHB-10118-sp]|uniref:Uncharacterized protein n=1 Tax=Phanerochaete carnosa (strain HHB-10118-sp) TaxID=650164 RepID=K5VYB3_PHACS|nr:uncharacterized protein PHACADRAFT_253781 [Phanerochaete carnosa HHB-10118-sp]EKM56573.1 hypothetical protein PHACADRAFT_253781 [Phanerochaete carnosa HHB-10118-sp]